VFAVLLFPPIHSFPDCLHRCELSYMNPERARPHVKLSEQVGSTPFFAFDPSSLVAYPQKILSVVEPSCHFV